MSKRKPRAVYEETQPYRKPSSRRDKHSTEGNIVNFNTYVELKRKPIALIPKSLKQEEYIDLLLDWNKQIIFAIGPAGTGKSMLGIQAGIKALKDGDVDRIVITRPAAGVDDESFGFLPGTLDQKMAPWVRPIIDFMSDYYSPRDIEHMIADQVIELSPLSFMRGRTFKNAWIIADEMQNSSKNQFQMLLTRIGENSKIVVTGDLDQLDRKFAKENGLRDFVARLEKSNSSTMSTVEFDSRDIQRHPVVKEVLDLYTKE